MEKEFVSYKQALKLKELGFKERCLTYYGENKPMISDVLTIDGWDYNTSFLNWTSRLTFSQAFRWFREEYGIYYVIEGSKKFGFQHTIYDEKETYEIKSEKTYNTYEESELNCLTKLIEIVKTKKEK